MDGVTVTRRGRSISYYYHTAEAARRKFGGSLTIVGNVAKKFETTSGGSPKTPSTPPDASNV
jgi:hypothetical protein